MSDASGTSAESHSIWHAGEAISESVAESVQIEWIEGLRDSHPLSASQRAVDTPSRSRPRPSATTEQGTVQPSSPYEPDGFQPARRPGASRD